MLSKACGCFSTSHELIVRNLKLRIECAVPVNLHIILDSNICFVVRFKQHALNIVLPSNLDCYFIYMKCCPRVINILDMHGYY